MKRYPLKRVPWYGGPEEHQLLAAGLSPAVTQVRLAGVRYGAKRVAADLGL
jgi:hypothetical protein